MDDFSKKWNRGKLPTKYYYYKEKENASLSENKGWKHLESNHTNKRSSQFEESKYQEASHKKLNSNREYDRRKEEKDNKLHQYEEKEKELQNNWKKLYEQNKHKWNNN